MKKILTLILMFLAVSAASAQNNLLPLVNGPPQQYSARFTVKAGETQTSNPIQLIGTGINLHKFTWSTTGTVSAGACKLEKAADASTWSDLITAQTVTTTGGPTALTSGSVNYARFYCSTAIVGTGQVILNYFGYIDRIASVSGSGVDGNCAQWSGGTTILGDAGAPCGTGSGGLAGSTGSTDNALLRADGTGGATVQSSTTATLSDAGLLSISTTAPGSFIGTPYASLSAAARTLLGAAYTSDAQFITTTQLNVPGALVAVSDVDGTNASISGIQANAVVTPTVNSANQITAESFYTYGAGTGNFGILAGITVNNSWDGAGTLANMFGVFVAAPNQGLTPGAVTQNDGIRIQPQGGTGVVNHTALHILPQGVAANDYAIYIDTGNNYLGPTTTSGGIFNAVTGFKINGAAGLNKVLLGDGTNFISGNVAYADVTGTPTLNYVTLAAAGTQTITGGFALSNSGGFTGGVHRAADGTAAAPGIVFATDLGVGFHKGTHGFIFSGTSADIIQFDYDVGLTMLGTNAILMSASTAAAADIAFTRQASGRLAIGTAYAGTDGNIRTASYQSAGTKYTLSTNTCAGTTTVGGATAGSFASGTTGTCTVVITMGSSATAPNGWACSAHDRTTPADVVSQTASSTTTATLSGTTASGDVISFSCIGY